MSKSIAVALALVGLTTATAKASPFVEGTDVGGTKAAAQLLTNWGDTDYITGTITSLSDLDYYRVSAPATTPGIYRHRINLTMTTGGRASTRGTGVAASPPTDVNFNSDRIGGEYLTWYSFGSAGEMYMRASRSSSGTNTYTMTQSLTTVSPTSIGTLGQGSHTLASALSGDSEIYLYDSNLALVGQNDSQTGGGVMASMVYNFTGNGIYFIAIGSGNSSTYVGVNTSPQQYSSNPAEPFYDSNFGGGARSVILDFQNVVSRPENLSRTAAEFGVIIDGGSPLSAGGPIGGQDMAWFQVEIIPEPASLALLALASLAGLRRRR